MSDRTYLLEIATDRGGVLVLIGTTLILVLLGVDISSDLHHGGDYSHILTEVLAFLVSLGIFTYALSVGIARVRKERGVLTQEIATLEHERNEWRLRASSALSGLASEIDRQFDIWKLSQSEKEIALFMLKGLSHKEIADMRSTSERTVRQQATAVYGKAGIEGKHQLLAFFLEDLMLPKMNPTEP